jgi:transitional endoplasmic reticulum ATPase
MLRTHNKDVPLTKDVDLEHINNNAHDFIRRNHVALYFMAALQLLHEKMDIIDMKDDDSEPQATEQYPMEPPEMLGMLGMSPSRGMLFHVPPGCGNMTLVNAIAKECEANCITTDGPVLLTMWHDKSGLNVCDLFNKARPMAPCILLINGQLYPLAASSIPSNLLQILRRIESADVELLAPGVD